MRVTLVRLIVVRLVLLVLAVQVSGVPEVCEDTCGISDRDCPLEKAGKSCSAGCPSCHVVSQLVVRKPSAIAVGPSVEQRIVLPIYESNAPRAPLLPGLYRPPRVVS